ncbi:uncharacterized protein LOC119662608 [Teleopsis dalmanni]|uniref:uncharacterized protein LOC119662608 n=1 Tax=Teleopsis dalmanni TaxID=139649 RepID=UPI0018CD8E18|nr:uncharacterized protein LOC119662608 [Teleopsis dalmanni]
MPKTGKFIINSAKEYKNRSIDNRSEININVPTLAQRLEFSIAVLNRLLIGFVTFYMCWMCLRLKVKEIPFHALFCTVGFVFLMAEGLMAHYRSNAWSQLCYRPEKTRLHWILQLIGSIVGIIGIGIKICLENKHFYTIHGVLGLVTLILCLVSLASGLSSLYANELKQRLQPIINKAVHNALGLCTFTLAMLSMYYSFETEIFMDYSLDAANYMDFRLLMQIMICLILILSSYGPLWCFLYSKIWKCC